MAEERTVSAFTKINTADRANQKVSTIVNITKVKQHLRRSATKRPRPIVRFRDLSKYVKDGSAVGSNELRTEQAAITHTPSTSSPSTPCTQPNVSEVVGVDTEGVDEGNELDETLWEDSDSEEEDENDRKRLAATRAAASTDVMDIEECEGVNVQVPDLLDLLSDAPVSGSTVGAEAPPKVTKNLKGKTSQGPRVFEVSEIHF